MSRSTSDDGTKKIKPKIAQIRKRSCITILEKWVIWSYSLNPGSFTRSIFLLSFQWIMKQVAWMADASAKVVIAWHCIHVCFGDVFGWSVYWTTITTKSTKLGQGCPGTHTQHARLRQSHQARTTIGIRLLHILLVTCSFFFFPPYTLTFLSSSLIQQPLILLPTLQYANPLFIIMDKDLSQQPVLAWWHVLESSAFVLIAGTPTLQYKQWSSQCVPLTHMPFSCN